MNERLLSVSAEIGQDSVTLGLGEFLIQFPFQVMLVYVSARPNVNDAGLTMQVETGGVTEVLDADLAVDTAAVPVEWKSKHFGGAYNPVTIAKDTTIEIDIKGAPAASTRVQYSLIFLCGEA